MKNTRKKLVAMAVIFVALLAVRMSVSLPQAYAMTWDDFWGTDDGEEQTAGVLSFTSYQLDNEGLNPLTTDEYNEALTTDKGNLKTFILRIVDFALGFLGLIAVLVVIYGGILYVTAAGTQERADKGKKAITYAAIGLLIILGSFAFVNTIIKGGSGEDGIGGTGGIEGTGDGSGATRNSVSFNAASMQLMAVAQDIYTGFEFLAQATEDLKSIKNDAAKTSLDPKNYPSKGEILEFLSGIKNKLVTMRNRVEQYSESEKQINNLIRSVETDVDRINAWSDIEWLKYNGDTGEEGKDCKDGVCYCNEDLWEGNGKPGEGKCEKNEAGYCSESRDQYCSRTGFIHYQKGLLPSWACLLKTKYLPDDDSWIIGIEDLYCDPFTYKEDELGIYDLATQFGTDYHDKMLTNYTPRMYEVWSFISVVETVANGEAGELFKSMISNYLDVANSGSNGIYGQLQEIDANGNGKLEVNEIYDNDGSILPALSGVVKQDSLAGRAKDWSIADEDVFYSAAKYLKNGLAAHKSLYDILLKIKFVDARLRADVSRGNAPLTVTFTAFDTVDPAGGSLYGGADTNTESGEDLIEWDLAGQKIVELLEVSSYESDLGKAEIGSEELKVCTAEGEGCHVVCSPISEYSYGTGGEDGTVRGTAWRCTYNYPGIYKAAIKVRSRDPKKYAPGIAVVPIVVTPPATAINLSVNGIWVSLYNTINGDDVNPDTTESTLPRFREHDLSSLAVTKTDAEAGIEFDAHTSLPSPTKYKMTFGDGKIEENADGTFIHQYSKLGDYDTVFEVTNKSGIVDKKRFTLQVREVVAQFSTNPVSNFMINEPITFDASNSKSELGQLTYEWSCTGGNPTENECGDFNLAADSKKTFNYTFKKTAVVDDYKITLKVYDGANSATTTSTYKIKSQSPVAIITYQNPDEYQPTTVKFAGGQSYDPDAGQAVEKYTWSVSSEDSSAKWECTYPEANCLQSKTPTIKFLGEGIYEVTLNVTNDSQETNATPTNITVNVNSSGDATEMAATAANTDFIPITDQVDIAWETMGSTGIVKDGKADITFKFHSDYVDVLGKQLPYEIDFGDGKENILSGTYCKTMVDPCTTTGTITYSYKKPGKFKAALTVYDPNDYSKTISKTILIGNGKNPMAKINVVVGDVNMTQAGLGTEEDAVPASRADTVRFDASESVNTDGTGRNLIYNWNFNAEKDPVSKEDLSTNKTASHQYKETQTTPYKVTLKVCKKEEPEICGSDEAYITIVNMIPEVSGLSAIPDKNNATLTTPVTVNLKAFNSTDSDGKIAQYRWWYAHVNQSTGKLDDEQLGVVVTTSPSAQVIIGSDGKAGDKRQYGFGLTITDGEGAAKTITSKVTKTNNKYNAIPGVESINEKNDIPVAKFTIDKTKVFIDEKVTFTSISTDPDGKVDQYMWDLEGNGFGDNEWTKKSIIDHTYTKKNLDGYQVKLKVKDAKGAESVASEAIAVYVDAESENPTAAFKFQVVPNTDGKEIKFLNNSTADEANGAEITECIWDFDKLYDSDGDGIADNDVDSTKCDGPKIQYDNYGQYTVKLVVTDNKGGTDEVSNKFKLPLSAPPTAAFIYEVNGDQVVFMNNSSVDPTSGTLVDYLNNTWDFDTTVDSNGDGIKDNDADSNSGNPTWSYPAPGNYNAKLTVQDDQGNLDYVVNPIMYGGQGGNVTGTTGTGTGSTVVTGTGTTAVTGTVGGNPQLNAVLNSTPAPSSDGIVYITANASGYGQVTLDFSKSLGPIARYIFDKNIYSDSNGNGIKDDDEDFNLDKSGTYTPSYHKSNGNVILKFTVKDVYGNSDSINLEIKFK